MKILHRYLLRQFTQNLLVALGVFAFLFLIFDFFDRIDNVLAEKPNLFVVLQYFALKVPPTISLMLPVACLVATLFTIGILSRNSEITAMRASGVTLLSMATPIIGVGLITSFFCLLLNETVVPYSNRRVREIYNLDIKQKDKNGYYSQSDFWWRSGNNFYSVTAFDSRTNTFRGLSKFEITKDFDVTKRTDAGEVNYVDPVIGWTMRGVNDYTFHGTSTPDEVQYKRYPLPITREPSEFYDVETDPHTMSFSALRRFMRNQAKNGLPVTSYLADLYEKIAFPFVCLLMCAVVFPFALKPARSGSMAFSVMSALVIGFSYYAIHSFAIALGRAEIMPPFIAAWTANVIMTVISGILILGAEAPA